MEFPSDIKYLIVKQTWQWRSPLRNNWREGSKIINHLKEDLWWRDYVYDQKVFYGDNFNDTWYDWCQDKLIIGPPRYRSEQELTGFNQEYMSDYDIERHYVPWVHTWPESGEYLCSKIRGVPDWAKQEYMNHVK